MNIRQELESAKGEREPHSVLMKYPLAVFSAVNSYPTNGYLIPEFSLGGEFFADFVAVSGASGMLELEFIELEPIDTPMFNKKGDPSPRLSHAIRQVSDWRAFAKRNDSYLRDALNKQSMKKDILHEAFRDEGIQCNAGLPITDLRVNCFLKFHIFIGRRHDLTPELMERKTSMSEGSNFLLGSWDRFMDFGDTNF